MSIIGKKLIMSSGQNSSGLLYVWGNNTAGLLGVGTPGNTPGKIDSQSWKSVTFGERHAAAIRSDGALFTWGCNMDGQLGLGDLNDRSTPTRVDTNSWSVIAAGSSHTVAIQSTGGLFQWGDCVGSTGRSLIPSQVGTSSWSAVAAGCFHSLAIRTDSKLFAWGSNFDGQVGNGGNDTVESPTQIGTENWQCVVASGNTSGGIRGDQRLFIWGNTENGQIGNNLAGPIVPGTGNSCGVCSPVQVGSDLWSHVSIGGSYAVAGIRTNNTLYTWGYNRQGQLGNPNSINTAVNTMFLSAGPYTRSTWKKIALSKGPGQGHGAALREDGALFMWGRNDFGQTGVPLNVSLACLPQFINKPTRVCATFGGTVSNWYDVSLGAYHTIAITSPTTGIMSWGRNNYGQLGRSTTLTADPSIRYVSTPAGLCWKGVAAGLNHNLAVTSFVGTSPRSVFAWGDNRYGQLGICSVINKSCAVAVCAPTGLAACAEWVITGANHSIAQASCIAFSWGKNVDGQLGRSSILGTTCVPVCIGITLAGCGVGTRIVAGSDHNVMSRLGCLFTWGRNNFGQLGNGNTTGVSTPTLMDSSFGSWTSIGAGFYNSFASKGATLSGWGRNDFGQLGDGTTAQRCRPQALIGRNPIPSFSAGSHLQGSNYGVLAIATCNNCSTINAWGRSTSELRYIQPVPVQTNESSWSCVAATDKNMIAIRADGNVFTWGYNCSGQIGNGTFAPQPQSVSSPVQLGSVGTGCAIAFGPDRAAVINTQSSLYTWGKNPDNMFLARQTQAFVPVKLDNQKWKEVSVSPLIRYPSPETCGSKRIDYNTYYAGHTTAIRKDGALFTWGFNSYGQLGDGTFTKRNTPTCISNQSWSAISAGTYHTLGIRADGALFAWGRNNNGQIGDLSTVNRCSPVQIGTQSWVSVKSGKNHSLAIRSDCILFAWGSNEFGQLGNGTTISSSSPIQIGTCSWCSIEPGLDSSLGITVNNTLFGWGFNCYGPVNNSNKICYSAPTQISGSWKCVALGAADRISRFASISATGDTCLAVAKGTNYIFNPFGDIAAMITSTNKLSSCGFEAGNNSWSWSRINIGGDTIAGIRY